MRLPVLALLGVAVLAAAPIPAPVVVDEPGDLAPGSTLTPAVLRIGVPADGALVTHHLAVGSGERVVFDLAVHEIQPATDGTPELGPASEAVRLPASSITLDAGERATVTSLVRGGVSEPRLLGVTATPRGAGRPALVGLVVVTRPGAPRSPAPDLGVTLDDEVATVTLTAGGPTHGVADLRVRLSTPVGPTILDDTLRDVLVWPDRDRPLIWALDLPPWPVPYTLEVVATAEGDVSRAEVTVWPPLRAWLPAAAALLLLLATVAWWLVRRRDRDRDRGRGGHAGGAPGNPG